LGSAGIFGRVWYRVRRRKHRTAGTRGSTQGPSRTPPHRSSTMKLFVFPRWANKTRSLAGLLLGATPLYVVGLVWYGASPKTTDVGYMPEQPVPYSHALHVGQLGLDCRYCHNTVEDAAVAA